MNELAETDRFGLVPSANPEFVKGIRKAVEMMFDSLNTYGKPATPNMLDAWILMLTASHVRAIEIGPAVQHFLSGRDMPTVGEFVSWIIDQRKDTVLLDSLKRGVEIADKEADERRTARCVEIFGTEFPVPGQWRDYVLAKYGEDLGEPGDPILPPFPGLRKMPTTSHVADEGKRELIDAQIAFLKGEK